GVGDHLLHPLAAQPLIGSEGAPGIRQIAQALDQHDRVLAGIDAPWPALGEVACAASPISTTGPWDQTGLVGMSYTGWAPICPLLFSMIWLMSGRSPENRSSNRRLDAFHCSSSICWLRSAP